MSAYIQAHRTTDTPFDVVFRGRAREQDAANATEILAQYAEAGVTWWLESFWSGELSEALATIHRGPPPNMDL